VASEKGVPPLRFGPKPNCTNLCGSLI